MIFFFCYENVYLFTAIFGINVSQKWYKTVNLDFNNCDL